MAFFFLLLFALFSGACLALSILVPAGLLARRGENEIVSLGGGLVASAVAAWVCIFAFTVAPVIGHVVRLAIWVLIAAGALSLVRPPLNRAAAAIGWDGLTWPVLVSFGFGFLLLVAGFAGADLTDPFAVAANRFSHPLPNDNFLPYQFAQFLLSGTVPSPMNGDWLSSDRPPLQTGFTLLWTPPLMSADMAAYYYQGLATLLQMYALIGVYLLTRALSGSWKLAALTGVVAAASPLVIVHAVFVWPKLVPAGLLCVTAALFFTGEFNVQHRRGLIGAIAGLAAALALGAHGATAFVLVAFAAAALLLHRLPHWRFSVAGLGVFAVCYLPWTLYQRFVDPPGTRLVKWHLAGRGEPDGTSLSDALRAALGEVSVLDWIYVRWLNVKAIVAQPVNHLLDKLGLAFADDPVSFAAHLRALDFFTVSYSLGVLAPMIPLGLAGLAIARLRALTAATFLSLLVWAGLMFEPGNAIPHQGSLFPQLAVFAVSMVIAARISRILALVIAALQIVLALLVYFIFNAGLTG